MYGLVKYGPEKNDPYLIQKFECPSLLSYIIFCVRFIRVTFVELVKFKICLTDFWLI